MDTRVLILLFSLVAIGAVTMASAAVASFVLSSGGSARRRLDDVVQSTRLPQQPLGPSAPGAAGVAVSGALPSLAQVGRPSMLGSAGYQQAWAPAVYRSVQVGLAAVLGLTAWMGLGLAVGFPAALILGGVGYLLPGLWISKRLASRKRIIQNGLPDALDLMVVCLEAGAGVDVAIVKAASELSIAHPALAAELRMVSAETRAGATRLSALRNLAARTKVDDVRSLVAMLAQTERFGTSIVQALRTHADVSRSTRRQRAEERAAKIGVKLVFPLVLCMFPALYVVVLGPLVIQFVQMFAGQLQP